MIVTPASVPWNVKSGDWATLVLSGVGCRAVGAHDDVAERGGADVRDLVGVVPVRVHGVAHHRRPGEGRIASAEDAVVAKRDAIDADDLAGLVDDEGRRAADSSEDRHVGVPDEIALLQVVGEGVVE